tara:strand:+ start:1690 stop:1929 length:240 start_codon:yes stop_codon:yes gene_type:complete
MLSYFFITLLVQNFLPAQTNARPDSSCFPEKQEEVVTQSAYVTPVLYLPVEQVHSLTTTQAVSLEPARDKTVQVFTIKK